MAKRTGADFYFELDTMFTEGEQYQKWYPGGVYNITPRAYFDKHGCLSDKGGEVPKSILSRDQWDEMQESVYGCMSGTVEEARQHLLDLGFVEKKMVCD